MLMVGEIGKKKPLPIGIRFLFIMCVTSHIQVVILLYMIFHLQILICQLPIFVFFPMYRQSFGHHNFSTNLTGERYK